MTEETITSADQLDAMLLDEQITQEQYDELRQALESPPPPPQPEGGAATASEGPQPRLHKSWSPRLLGGVCGGLANHMGMSPDLVRILAIAALLVAPPVTLIVYFACYFLLPWDDREAAREPQEKGHPWRFAGILTGMCLIQFLFSQFAARQFVKIFEDLAAELPYLTRIALLISDVSTNSQLPEVDKSSLTVIKILFPDFPSLY